MKQKLCKFLAVFTAVTVLWSVTFTVSANSQSTGNGNCKKVEMLSEKKPVNKDTTKNNGKSNEKGSEKESAKIAKKNGKLDSIDKRVIKVETKVDKLSKQINAYINANTEGSTAAVTVTTTGAAVKTCKGVSLTGFVNGTKGKLNALSKRANAIEKSLKHIKTDSTNIAKYNELNGRLNNVKSKINADIKLLDSLTVKK